MESSLNGVFLNRSTVHLEVSIDSETFSPRAQLTSAGWALNSGAGGGAASGWTDDGAVVRLTTASDLVGIGIANPAAQLHLGGGSPTMRIGDGSVADGGQIEWRTTALRHWNIDQFGSSPDLRFYTEDSVNGAGLTRVTFNDSGNVGLGTSAPDQNLHVLGSSLATNAVFGTASYGSLDLNATTFAASVAASHISTNLLFNGSTWSMRNSGYDGWISLQRVQSDGAGYMEFIHAAKTTGTQTTHMRILGSGNVGIGSTNPGQKLSVAGTIESTSGGYKFPDGTTQTTAAAGGGGTVTSVGTGAGLTGGPITTSGTVSVAAGGITSAMIADGTITDADVSAAAAIAFSKLSGVAAASHTHGGADITSGTIAVGRGGTGTGTAFTSGSLVFAGSGGAYAQDNANLFWDNTNKRLGVGTGSPATKFHVSGGTGDSVRVVNSNEAPYAIMIINTTFGATDATGFGFWQANDGRGGIDVNGATRIFIKSNGNVGIGRTSTTNRLEVEGDASKTTAGSWLANSDRRIKKDVHGLEHPLDVVNALHPVKFHYTDAYRAEHPSIKDTYYCNFIAQEFRKVFPDSVQDDGTGLLQIDTYNVTPYLVAAMQELSAENRRLREALAAKESQLKDDVNVLRGEVNDLRRLVVSGRSSGAGGEK